MSTSPLMQMSASGHLRIDSHSPLGTYGTFIPNPEPSSEERPLIGVAVGHDTTKGVNYVRALHASGVDTWVVSSDEFVHYYNLHEPSEESPVVQCVRNLDGLVLTGGGDISEVMLGNMRPPDPTITGADPLRDLVDRDAFLTAWNEGKPMLCICRGAQVANWALGGTNYTDINTEVAPKGCEKGHRQIDQGIPKWEPTMPVELVSGTLVEGMFGKAELDVNHDHHQAIKDVAAPLQVAARCGDGVIEAVVAKDRPFVGLQWHPELMWQQHSEQQQPFLALAAQAKFARR